MDFFLVLLNKVVLGVFHGLLKMPYEKVDPVKDQNRLRKNFDLSCGVICKGKFAGDAFKEISSSMS
jgi:hypothetical protein